jgi:hypothetical protein
MKIVYQIFIVFLIIGCRSNFIKDVEYANRVLYAQYDGIVRLDELILYDNDVFKISIIDLEANGTYKIKGDTIYFDYYLYQGNEFNMFFKYGNLLYPINEKLNQLDSNSYLGIHTNIIWPETSGYVQPDTLIQKF